MKKALNILLPAELMDSLKELSISQDRTMTAIVRRLVEQELIRVEQGKPPFFDLIYDDTDYIGVEL